VSAQSAIFAMGLSTDKVSIS